jgi:hypothetical protein
VQDYILTVDLLREYHAVLVVAGYARSVAAIPFRREKIVRRYETDARTARRIPGVGDRITSFPFQPGDARIFHAPLFVWCIASNGRSVSDLVDVLAISGRGENETRPPGLLFIDAYEHHDAAAGVIDGYSGIEGAARPGEGDSGRVDERIRGKPLERSDYVVRFGSQGFDNPPKI